MKRVIALLLCALLLVPAMSANASSVSGERLEAYINENGRVSCALDGGNYDELPFDGVKKIVKKGDTMLKMNDVVHGCVCLEAGVLLDIFNPYRKDFVGEA